MNGETSLWWFQTAQCASILEGEKEDGERVSDAVAAVFASDRTDRSAQALT